MIEIGYKKIFIGNEQGYELTKFKMFEKGELPREYVTGLPRCYIQKRAVVYREKVRAPFRKKQSKKGRKNPLSPIRMIVRTKDNLNRYEIGDKITAADFKQLIRNIKLCGRRLQRLHHLAKEQWQGKGTIRI